jgi:hypothetical protein
LRECEVGRSEAWVRVIRECEQERVAGLRRNGAAGGRQRVRGTARTWRACWQFRGRWVANVGSPGRLALEMIIDARSPGRKSDWRLKFRGFGGPTSILAREGAQVGQGLGDNKRRSSMTHGPGGADNLEHQPLEACARYYVHSTGLQVTTLHSLSQRSAMSPRRGACA